MILSVDRYAFHYLFLEKVAASRVKGMDLRVYFSWILLSLLCFSSGFKANRSLTSGIQSVQMASKWASCGRQMRNTRSTVMRLEICFSYKCPRKIDCNSKTQFLALDGDSCFILTCSKPYFRTFGSTVRPRPSKLRLWRFDASQGSSKREY